DVVRASLLSFERPGHAVVADSRARCFSWGEPNARAHLENSIVAKCEFFTIKRLRAHGGCLGAKSRRRTWAAAISPGEVLTNLRSRDFRMGKPTRGNARVS